MEKTKILLLRLTILQKAMEIPATPSPLFIKWIWQFPKDVFMVF